MIGQYLQRAIPLLSDSELTDLLSIARAARRPYKASDGPETAELETAIERLYRASLTEWKSRQDAR